MSSRSHRSSSKAASGKSRTRRASRERTLRYLELEALAAGTLLAVPAWLKNVNPGTVDSSPGQFAEVGATVFFSATDNQHGRELWKTDGTDDGTSLVKDIDLGTGSSYPEYLINFGG